MTNDGTVIERAKSIKGGWVIQSLFEVFRHGTEIALASKFDKLKRDQVHISFSESFNESGYRGAHNKRETFTQANYQQIKLYLRTKDEVITYRKKLDRNK